MQLVADVLNLARQLSLLLLAPVDLRVQLLVYDYVIFHCFIYLLPQLLVLLPLIGRLLLLRPTSLLRLHRGSALAFLLLRLRSLPLEFMAFLLLELSHLLLQGYLLGFEVSVQVCHSLQFLCKPVDLLSPLQDLGLSRFELSLRTQVCVADPNLEHSQLVLKLFVLRV